MKAKLEFDLSSRDDKTSFHNAVNADKVSYLLFEIKYNLKKKANQIAETKGTEPLDEFYNLINEELQELANI